MRSRKTGTGSVGGGRFDLAGLLWPVLPGCETADADNASSQLLPSASDGSIVRVASRSGIASRSGGGEDITRASRSYAASSEVARLS